MKRLLLVILLLALALPGCALLTAADRLQGADLASLVKQENAAGCIKGLLNGAYLGNSGTFIIISKWGVSPPAACETSGMLP